MPVLHAANPAFIRGPSGLFVPDPSVSRGLIGHWLNEWSDNRENESGSIVDHSGNGYTGTLKAGGKQRRSSGPHPSARGMYFDGQANSAIILPTNLPIGPVLCFSVWCRHKADTGSAQTVFRLGSSGSNPYLNLGVSLVGGVLNPYWNVGTYVNFPVGTPGYGNWAQVGLSWDGITGHQQYAYYNGVEQYPGAAGGNAGAAVSTIHYIGESAVFGEYMWGDVFSLRLYNRALREGEMREIYEIERQGLEESYEQALGRSFVFIGAAGVGYPHTATVACQSVVTSVVVKGKVWAQSVACQSVVTAVKLKAKVWGSTFGGRVNCQSSITVGHGYGRAYAHTTLLALQSGVTATKAKAKVWGRTLALQSGFNITHSHASGYVHAPQVVCGSGVSAVFVKGKVWANTLDCLSGFIVFHEATSVTQPELPPQPPPIYLPTPLTRRSGTGVGKERFVDLFRRFGQSELGGRIDDYLAKLAAATRGLAAKHAATHAPASGDDALLTWLPMNPTGTVASEGVSDLLLRADSTTKQGIVEEKGDILTHNETVPAALPVGGNSYQLTARSTEQTGLLWVPPGTASIIEVTADYELTLVDEIVLVDATGGDVLITLPTAATAIGKTYTVKKVDLSSNDVVLRPTGVEQIDWLDDRTISDPWQSLTVVSNGTGWRPVAEYHDPAYTDLDPDLIAWWSFDEASGVRRDLTGNGHDLQPWLVDPGEPGELAGAPGVVGNAAAFDGFHVLRTLAPFSPLPEFGPWTFTGWLEPAVSDLNQTVLGGIGIQATADRFAGVFSLSFIVVSADAMSIATPSVSLASATGPVWYSLRSDGTALYLRVRQGTGDAASTAPWSAGVSQDAYANFQFGGTEDEFTVSIAKLDETVIFARCLLTSEENYLYNDGAGRAFPG